MPETWRQEAQKVFGDADAPMTPENQNTMAQAHVDRLLEKYGGNEGLVAASIYGGEGLADSILAGKPLYDLNTRMNEEGYLDPNGKYPSVNEYVQDVLSRKGKVQDTDSVFHRQEHNKTAIEIGDIPEDVSVRDGVQSYLEGDLDGASEIAQRIKSPALEKLVNEKKMQEQISADDLFFDTKKASMERQVKNIKEAKTVASEFVNVPLKNEATNMTAIVSNKTLGKMLSDSAIRKSANPFAHLQAVANIDVLFRNAETVPKHADRNSDRNIKSIHRMYAPMELPEGRYQAKLTVKELVAKEGNRIYSVEAIDINKKPTLRAPKNGIEPDAGQNAGHSGQRDFDKNITKDADFVNKPGVEYALTDKVGEYAREELGLKFMEATESGRFDDAKKIAEQMGADWVKQVEYLKRKHENGSPVPVPRLSRPRRRGIGPNLSKRDVRKGHIHICLGTR